ncbi:unnamed protein product, partial [Adineta steineri]
IRLLFIYNMRSSFRHWILSIKGEKLPTIVAIWLYFMHNMRQSFRHWILSIKGKQ